MNILIVTGGTTSERKISLVSANSCRKALELKGHKVTLFDLKKGVANLRKIVSNFDVIFPIIHGRQGEDGSLYNLLRKFGKPFIGNDCLGTKKAFNKITFKKFCDKNKLPTAKWTQIKCHHDILNFGAPSVLKAANGGSSREVLILKSQEEITGRKVNNLLRQADYFFVEEYLEGVEVTAPILQDKPLPLVEIVPPEGQWFDYNNKYNGQTKELVGAPSLDEKTKRHIQFLVLFIHKKLELGPYSRTDIIVSNNQPYILETNSPCGVGFTDESLFPKAAAAAGISFPQLVDYLINLAIKKPTR